MGHISPPMTISGFRVIGVTVGGTSRHGEGESGAAAAVVMAGF
jgi:hypothetical protein